MDNIYDHEMNHIKFFINFYNDNDNLDIKILQTYNEYYKYGSNKKLERMYQNIKHKLLKLSKYIDNICNSIENKLNINKKLEVQLNFNNENNLIILFYDNNSIIYTEKINNNILENFNYCSAIYITNILSENCKYLYDILINNNIIEPIERIKWSKIDVHDKIKIQYKIKSNQYGNKINYIINQILIESKLIPYNDIINHLSINNYNIDDYILLKDYKKIIINFFKKFKYINYHIYCGNFKIYGIIDYILDDILLDLKVYSKYTFTHKEYLQIILYYCLYNKTSINKIGIYDFYNGEINLFDTTNIDKSKILNIVYKTFSIYTKIN
jgi:hypothetical protein